MFYKDWPKNIDALLVFLDTLHPYSSASLMQNLSGFTGSAGTLLKRKDSGVLVTDSRYIIQAQKELEGKNIAVQGHEKSLNLSGSIGADPRGVAFSTWSKWQRCVEAQGGTLCAVDMLEHNAQTYSWCSTLLPEGKTFQQKQAFLEQELQNGECEGLLLTCPELISWLLNVREPGRPYIPYCDVRIFLFDGKNSTVFVGDQSVQSASVLEGVSVHSILDVEALDACMYDKVWAADMCKTSASMAQWMLQKELSLKWISFPILQQAKAVKDAGELEHMQQRHLCEAEALAYVLAHMPSYSCEGEVVQALEQKRAQNSLYWGPSFPTISAFSSHSKIVHYRPGQDDSKMGEGAFLLDAGGHYAFATTDMTRSFFLGSTVPEAYKKDYTSVLKAHISLAQSVFPVTATVAQLDGIARQPLWSVFRDYQHSTGHGVGSALNVHESPPMLSSMRSGVLCPGMVVSIEPGFYEGDWGVRLENLYYVAKAQESESFLCFKPLTAVPFEASCVDRSLLSETERSWLCQYHAWVWGVLKERLPKDLKGWLRDKVGAFVGDEAVSL